MSDREARQSVAQSLRQATQLLLLAAERLDASDSLSTCAHDTPRTEPASETSQPRPALRECLDSLRDDRSSSSRRPSHNHPGTPASSVSSANGGTPVPLFQPLQHSRRRHWTKKYRPYSEKRWQHVFVCLSQVGQFIPPDTADRVRLVQAGLGEKRVSCGWGSGVDELHRELLSAFPRLRSGGGYEFLKIDEASRRHLSVVPPPAGGYSPTYLRAVFLQAKVFIRPLQRNLDLAPIEEEVIIPNPSTLVLCLFVFS